MSLNLVVQRRRPERFLMVPHHVLDLVGSGELTGNAFAALCVLMRQPDGWHWPVASILAATGLGRDGWQAARRVLVKAGAVVELAPERDPSGRVCGRRFSVDWPLARKPAKPVDGEKAADPLSPGTGFPGRVEPDLPVPLLRHIPAGAAAAFAAKRRARGRLMRFREYLISSSLSLVCRFSMPPHVPPARGRLSFPSLGLSRLVVPRGLVFPLCRSMLLRSCRARIRMGLSL